MIQLHTEQIAQLLEMAENVEVELSELEIINWIMTFEKIVKILVLNNQEYQLQMGKYKLQSKFKRYNNKNCLVLNMKRNKK